MKTNIEEQLVKGISPLAEFLGADKVDDLKDKVCTLILNKIEQDLNETYEYSIIYDDDIREIAVEALEEVKVEIKQRLVNKYTSVVEDAIAKNSNRERRYW